NRANEAYKDLVACPYIQDPYSKGYAVFENGKERIVYANSKADTDLYEWSRSEDATLEEKTRILDQLFQAIEWAHGVKGKNSREYLHLNLSAKHTVLRMNESGKYDAVLQGFEFSQKGSKSKIKEN